MVGYYTFTQQTKANFSNVDSYRCNFLYTTLLINIKCTSTELPIFSGVVALVSSRYICHKQQFIWMDRAGLLLVNGERWQADSITTLLSNRQTAKINFHFTNYNLAK